MALEQFLADLDVLRSDPDSLPRTGHRMRWTWRRDGGSWFSTDPRDSILTAYLYPPDADARDRPTWQCRLEQTSPIESVAQGSACQAVGVLAAGRAVAIEVDGTRFMPTYPLSRPLRGPRFAP